MSVCVPRAGIYLLVCALVPGAAVAAQVELTWVPPTHNTDGSELPLGEVGGYRIYYATESGPPYDGIGYLYLSVPHDSPVQVVATTLADPANPGAIISGIPSCSAAYFVATAYNVEGIESDYSGEASKMVLDPPSRVTATATGGVGEIVVAWDPFVDEGSIASHQVYYGTSPGDTAGTGADQGDSPIAVAATESSLTLTGLTAGTTYVFSVEASCPDGTTDVSDEISVPAIDCGPSVCGDSDGCCPAACASDTDADCPPACGNGTTETGETCDGDCPVDCDDSNACTVHFVAGAPANCDVECILQPIAIPCGNGDGCCPPGCSALTDDDCAAACGNYLTEPGETCDGDCPATCDDTDPCTTNTETGAAVTCDLACVVDVIATCSAGDSCCPETCDFSSDSDCSTSCGDSVVQPPETCDGDCPDSCDDVDACTGDVMTGSAANCNVTCSYQAITECLADGCCPAGCTSLTDADCDPVCGNGLVESGEICDGDCPTTCADDGDACTLETLTGDASTCDAACASSPQTECADGNGCCPTDCTADNDSDCDPGQAPEPPGPPGEMEAIVGGCSCSAATAPVWAIGSLLALWRARRRR